MLQPLRQSMALVYSTAPKRIVFFFPTRIIHFSSVASPPSSADEPTVTDAVSILKHHRSKSRWTHLRTLFPSGFTPSQFSQITLQLRNKPHLALRFFLFTVQHSLCHHSLSSYASIIHTLARSRQKSQTLTLIRTAIRKFNDPNNNSPPNTPSLIFFYLNRYKYEYEIIVIDRLKWHSIENGFNIGVHDDDFDIMVNYPPDKMSANIWQGLCSEWNTDEWRKKAETARNNRKGKDSSAMLSRHTGGSIGFDEHRIRLVS
ncbi:hypothetical protein L1987_08263 [Smallanthus sonchifolius]|uniref:Uncharacterized protein n=1 Tax=Smallanthus sonchifolius TaxID=185202 RepID=A0ACB9JMF0_9ASTR|nr:hypothetical protein L1987_08263 [Smallanthus sonchifolius]